jgi:hypothetical protein
MLQKYILIVLDFSEVCAVFHMDDAKIDRDVAHVVMVVHVCGKRPFQMFHLLFQTYVASVLIWMLRMFHTYVAMFKMF